MSSVFENSLVQSVWRCHHLNIFHILLSSFLVDVLLKAVGDTPIMKTKKWALERGRTVQSVSQFISRYLKLSANEQLVSIQSWHEQKCQTLNILAFILT